MFRFTSTLSSGFLLVFYLREHVIKVENNSFLCRVVADSLSRLVVAKFFVSNDFLLLSESCVLRCRKEIIGEEK